MLGAIIGDYVGSKYEFNNIKTKDFPLFDKECFFTDDSVMTLAAAEAVMNGGSKEAFIKSYKMWGRVYPFAGYGGRFRQWLKSDSAEAYDSYGNGSAMRVSPCGYILNYKYYAKTGEWNPKELQIVTNSAIVSHNHPEGIKGAQAVAEIIALCRYYLKGQGEKHPDELAVAKEKVRELAENRFGYDLSKTLDEIRPNYRFGESCQDTVPQAITAFLESNGFEDAIRNAISLGGDSDTLAAITGSIAEAAYGISHKIKSEILGKMDRDFIAVYKKWTIYLNNPFRLLWARFEK